MKIASWIPTTERLPEKACFCAVLTNGDTQSTTWAFYALETFLIFLPDPHEGMNMVGIPTHDSVSHWFDPATLPIDDGWTATEEDQPLEDMKVLFRNNGNVIEGYFVDGYFYSKEGQWYTEPSHWKPLDPLISILHDECDKKEKGL